jgi:hypothetical protein
MSPRNLEQVKEDQAATTNGNHASYRNLLSADCRQVSVTINLGNYESGQDADPDVRYKVKVTLDLSSSSRRPSSSSHNPQPPPVSPSAAAKGPHDAWTRCLTLQEDIFYFLTEEVNETFDRMSAAQLMERAHELLAGIKEALEDLDDDMPKAQQRSLWAEKQIKEVCDARDQIREFIW